MNRLKKFLADTAAALAQVALRYPAETALCLYACILGAIRIEGAELPDGVFTMLPLAMLATLIVHTLLRPAARAWQVLYPLVPVLLAAASWLLGERWFGTNRFFITTAILAPLGLFMARRTVSNGPFVRQTLGYLRAAAVGGLFALTAMLAAMAIYHSVVYIFNISSAAEFPHRADAYICLLSWALLWPLSALARLDRCLGDELQGSKTTDTLLNGILSPALLVYAAILYLYCLQILLTWSLPKGGVAYLVFGFTIALFGVKALQELVMRRRFDWFFDRVSGIALPPLVLFWAGAAQRIADYGLTELRVYLVVCGAIMTAAVGFFLWRRTARYYGIAATAFVCFFATAYIPCFSAERLSLRSQAARAERLAAAAGLLDEAGRLDLSRIDERDTVRIETYHRLYASLDYLDDNDTLLLAERFGIARSRAFTEAFRSQNLREYIRWGANRALAEVVDGPVVFALRDRSQPLDIAGLSACYDAISHTRHDLRARCTTSGDTLRLYLPDGRELFVRSFGDLLRERAAQLRLTPGDEALYTAEGLLTFRTDSLLIVFSRAEASRTEGRYVSLDVDRFYTK